MTQPGTQAAAAAAAASCRGRRPTLSPGRRRHRRRAGPHAGFRCGPPPLRWVLRRACVRVRVHACGYEHCPRHYRMNTVTATTSRPRPQFISKGDGLPHFPWSRSKVAAHRSRAAAPPAGISALIVGCDSESFGASALREPAAPYASDTESPPAAAATLWLGAPAGPPCSTSSF